MVFNAMAAQCSVGAFYQTVSDVTGPFQCLERLNATSSCIHLCVRYQKCLKEHFDTCPIYSLFIVKKRKNNFVSTWYFDILASMFKLRLPDCLCCANIKMFKLGRWFPVPSMLWVSLNLKSIFLYLMRFKRKNTCQCLLFIHFWDLEGFVVTIVQNSDAFAWASGRFHLCTGFSGELHCLDVFLKVLCHINTKYIYYNREL